MIEAGTYKAVCDAADLGYTNDNKPQVALSMRITEGENQGARLVWYGYFTEKTLKSTIRALRACGWIGTDISDIRSCIIDNGGKQVTIVVEHEEDLDGRVRARVRWINEEGGPALKRPMTAEERVRFAAQLEATLLRVKDDPDYGGSSSPPAADSRQKAAENRRAGAQSSGLDPSEFGATGLPF